MADVKVGDEVRACWLCEMPVGFPVYVPTDDGFKPAHRACAVAAITGVAKTFTQEG